MADTISGFVPSRLCDLAEATGYQPFEGDELDAAPLSDKIVRAAKAHPECHMCAGPIAKGEKHRALTERNNEERTVETFRFCGKCTRAMAFEEVNCGLGLEPRLTESRDTIGGNRRRGGIAR